VPNGRNERRYGADLDLWSEHDAIREILVGADDNDEARTRLLGYVAELEEALHHGAFDLDRIEWRHALEAIDVLRTMAAPESENIAGFSTIGLLRATATGEIEPSETFVEEFARLFRAMAGDSGIGKGWHGRSMDDPAGEDEFPGSGRTAARRRSQRLDRLADDVWQAIGRYPNGLDDALIAERSRNRERILSSLDAAQQDWESVAWQVSHVFRGEEGVARLRALVPLTSEDLAALHLASRRGIAWGITPYYLSLFDFTSARRTRDGQVRAQVLPPIHTVRSMVEHRCDRKRALDYMKEGDTSPADRITRRYATVAIFKICDTCPQICMYCQRNWEIADAMDPSGIPSLGMLEQGVEWFAAHPQVTDVLLTGGDPLVQGNAVISRVLERLSDLNHVSSIRIGTRIPVTLPMRIDDATAAVIGSFIDPGRRSIEVVTHVQSAAEITPDLAACIDRLRRHRVPVYNQQVFTLETSRRFQTCATRCALRRVGIDPYYTFYAKGKDEHRDALVPIPRLLQERKEEARLLPGVFRTDEPVFNVPGLGKSHLRARQDRELIGIRADGRRVYLFHPWEKGIAPVAPWPYVDVSVGDYLDRLRGIGEDPSDYESIWYYY